MLLSFLCADQGHGKGKCREKDENHRLLEAEADVSSHLKSHSQEMTEQGFESR